MPVRRAAIRAQAEACVITPKAVAVLILAVSSSLTAQSTEPERRVDSIPVTFSYTASGFVLGNLNGSIDPFYHASALLHVRVTAQIGDNVEVPIRVLTEAWNFSQSYGGTFTTVRPAIRIATRRRGSGDSLAFVAGDLWRVRHGEGLLLEDFESRGAAFGAYTGSWTFSGHVIGFGWTGADDLYSLSLGYAGYAAIRFFYDSPDILPYAGSRILSADGRITMPVAGELYGEIARNVDARRWGGLIGLRRRLGSGRDRLSVRVEYRHYDRNFFRNEDNSSILYFYFPSLTALDKPLHSFHVYQTRRGRHDVVAAHLQGRAYLGSWFVDADVEAIAGTIHEIAYEAAMGFNANPLVDLRVGLLNKIFQLPATMGDMFRLRELPWYFMKVTIDLSARRR